MMTELDPGMTILVVDDDAVSRAVLRRNLLELGHAVTLANDGEQGWSRFLEQRPDVVITDWLMPGLDGPGLCRRIRAHGGSAYTYVVLVTGLDEGEHVLAGMEAGADDYLAKPARPSDLQARLVAARRLKVLHLRLGRQQLELEQLNADLGVVARTDSLTDLPNRMRMEEDLRVAEARLERYGHGLGVAMFDIDRFKAVNDLLGHHAGDEVLRQVAAVLRSSLRAADEVYRYGGEEFVCLLSGLGEHAAYATADRLRTCLRDAALPHPSVPGAVVSVSAGVATSERHPGASVHELVRLADAALYRAKAAGRDRVEVAPPPG